MAIMSVWMEVESTMFDLVASKLSFELPLLGMVTDNATVAENEDNLGKILDVYEMRLRELKHLGEDSLTLADMHHVPVIHPYPSYTLLDRNYIQGCV